MEGPTLTESVAREPALCASMASAEVAAACPKKCGAGRAVHAVRDCARVTAAITVVSACATAEAPIGSGELNEARTVGPSANLAIATVMDACGSLGEVQRPSFVDILSVHLEAEIPRTFRSMSGKGRDIIYTPDTVPQKAVVGPRQASRWFLEESSAVTGLFLDSKAAV